MRNLLAALTLAGIITGCDAGVASPRISDAVLLPTLRNIAAGDCPMVDYEIGGWGGMTPEGQRLIEWARGAFASAQMTRSNGGRSIGGYAIERYAYSDHGERYIVDFTPPAGFSSYAHIRFCRATADNVRVLDTDMRHGGDSAVILFEIVGPARATLFEQQVAASGLIGGAHSLNGDPPARVGQRYNARFRRLNASEWEFAGSERAPT